MNYLNKSALFICCFFSVQVGASDQRINVMECSEQEVNAYVQDSAPDLDDIWNYQQYKKAYIQTKVKDPKSAGQCLSLLYEDLGELYDNMKLATSILVSTAPDASTLIDMAMEQLGDSICNRMDSAVTDVLDNYVDQMRDFADDQADEAISRVGKKALKGKLEDLVNGSLDKNFEEGNLRYRNGEVDPDGFKSGVKDKWKEKLKDLKENI